MLKVHGLGLQMIDRLKCQSLYGGHGFQVSQCGQHVVDLEEMFRVIRKYDMCLNPEKYTFGVDGEKFLGFMITYWGIEANPNNYTIIQEMQNLTNVKEIQKLNDNRASLFRFLMKLAKKTKPFYRLLRKTESFLWDEASKQAFLAFKIANSKLTKARSTPTPLP